jgi:hypothetical protein
MANLLANTKVTYGVQHDFYQHRFYGGDTYFHYKTNIQLATYIMFMIEAIGYAYGANSPIRASWVGYSYDYLANPNTATVYGGLSAHGVYVSSDSRICIRANAASYFSGWCFNAYTLNPTGYGHNVQFTAVSQNANSGNYY